LPLAAEKNFMSRYRIAVLPGDGIGPEVMDVTLRCCAAPAGQNLNSRFTNLELLITGRQGTPSHKAVVDDCLKADAVLFGAVWPARRAHPRRNGDSTGDDGRPAPGARPLCRRPADQALSGAPTPLRDPGKGIDFIILRENLEGLFASYGGGCLVGDQLATDSIIITRAGTERVVDYAFTSRSAGKPAARRQADRPPASTRQHLSQLRFFRKVFFEIAARHPEIGSEATYVDAASMYLLQNPQAFDVLVMENQFGDILFRSWRGLVGGLGMAPRRRSARSMRSFKPSHGTAPQIAGKDRCQSAGHDLVGGHDARLAGRDETRSGSYRGRSADRKGCRACAGEGKTFTPDLGGSAGTTKVGDAVGRAMNWQAQG